MKSFNLYYVRVRDVRAGAKSVSLLRPDDIIQNPPHSAPMPNIPATCIYIHNFRNICHRASFSRGVSLYMSTIIMSRESLRAHNRITIRLNDIVIMICRKCAFIAPIRPGSCLRVGVLLMSSTDSVAH